MLILLGLGLCLIVTMIWTVPEASNSSSALVCLPVDVGFP